MKRLQLLGLALAALALTSGVGGSAVRAAELKISASLHLKFALKSVGTIKLFETLGGKAFVCSGTTGSGEFTSDRLGSIEFKFTGCEFALLKVICTGLSDTESHITMKAEVHVRHLLPNSEGVDILVLISQGHFSCGGILMQASGCVASMDVLTKSGGESVVNKQVEKAFIDFLQEKGDQKPTSITTDNSLEMEECAPRLKEGSAETEGAGQAMEIELEKFEVGPAALLVVLNGTF